jgi:hypothetical protein
MARTAVPGRRLIKKPKNSWIEWSRRWRSFVTVWAASGSWCQHSFEGRREALFEIFHSTRCKFVLQIADRLKIKWHIFPF